jgi:hypothetical protein
MLPEASRPKAGQIGLAFPWQILPFHFLTTIVMLILTKCLFLLLTLVMLSVIFKIFYTSIRSDLANRTISTIKKTT